MKYATLENVIRQRVTLGRKNKKGWEECLHLTCDHGRKGNRAAFLFNDGQTAFHCFNCEIATTYNPETHYDMPNKMVGVLGDFNIPEDEWKEVLFGGLVARDSGLTGATKKQSVLIEPDEIELPAHFYYLKDAKKDDKWALIANDYLTHSRCVDPDSYPFMLAKTTTPKANKWKGRIIIPIYKGNKLIYYTGRALAPRQKKYETPAISKSRILYGFDQLFRNTDAPLYVVEGWFDACVIDGVAVLGNILSAEHIAWLNKSRRPKVYIPDKSGDGKKVALHALQLGWSISTPDIAECKDINQAVHKYGKLYVTKSIVENIAIDFDAHNRLGIYCHQ
jgi:hypothetical protein